MPCSRMILVECVLHIKTYGCSSSFIVHASRICCLQVFAMYLRYILWLFLVLCLQGPLNPFTSGSAESWQWAIESSPNVSESSLPPSNASSSWVLPRSPTQDWCDSSIQTTLSSRSSGSSMSSLFDDPNAPSVAQWCAVLGDQRNVIQEDFERLNLSGTLCDYLSLCSYWH